MTGWRGENVTVPTARGSRGPNQAFGYYAGYGPNSGGAGSGGGAKMAGTGTYAQGQGSGVNIAGQSWHPSILYLFALIVAEMVVFGFVAKLLR